MSEGRSGNVIIRNQIGGWRWIDEMGWDGMGWVYFGNCFGAYCFVTLSSAHNLKDSQFLYLSRYIC